MSARLADVLPAVAVAIGAREPDPAAAIVLPPASRAVVVLVDGLGARLLARRAAYAPFLSRLLDAGQELSCGFPSTTATSMGSFGTGLPPGAHGLVGYQVLDPATDRLLNELSWEDGPDPRRWQPHPTVFESMRARGYQVAHIGPGFFAGSGLTECSFRGARLIAADTLDDRVDACVGAIRSGTSSLVYLYWGEVDKVGHVEGCDSPQWCDEVAAVDLAIRTLAARLPAQTLLVVTADHGMVDVPIDGRLDLAAPNPLARALSEGVRWCGGEPRAPMLYCEPGRAEEVLARWRGELGDRFEVLSRDEAVAAGWFGPVEDRVLPRIGDIVASALGEDVVQDSRVHRPELLRLVGMHGARTDDETAIPLLVHLTG